METILTSQYVINKESKNGLNMGNVCYYLVQNLLYSCMLSKSVGLKYTITRHSRFRDVGLYLFTKVSGKHIGPVFEVQAVQDCFMVNNSHQLLLRRSNQGELIGLGK